jgi:hypothetical protein
MRRLSIVAWMAAALLVAACGGGSQTISTTSKSPGTGTGTGTGTPPPVPTATPASLTAMSSATSIPSDGSATATITILARNSSNNLISGVVVAFVSDSGGVAITKATTDSSGSATATLSTAGDSTARTITVTATASGLKATVKVQVVATSSAATTAVATLTLTSSVTSILTDGTTTAAISALARDASNNVLAGVPVTFTASSGAIQVTLATTDAAGMATATVSTGGDSSLRTITVTGSTSALTSTVQVKVVPPSTPTIPVYAMGNGTGTGFVSGAIGLAVSGTLAAGGAAGFQLSIVDQTGTLYTGAPVIVNFNSPCIASRLAEILPSGSSIPVTTITTATGSINATYAAKGCSGTDKVTASATVGSQSLSATGTLTIAAASIGSIQFMSATPPTIGLKGTGLNETSTVIFKVTDSSGGARAGVLVSFALDTTVGGLTLSPASATSASDGTVQTVVSAGTVHTVVRVTASIASPALSTQSRQLTVTTGLPASGAFSIAVGPANYGSGPSSLACPNVEASEIDGVTVPVTVRLADRYNNPVPDGTAVAFTTDGGHIVGSCTTPSSQTNSGDGTCTATWTSANPRPGVAPVGYVGNPLAYGYPSGYPPLLAAGRAVILATTIGEESFTDLNASGFWQTGDPFADLGEPYRADNEQPQYDVGDYFLDFNQNGKWDAGSGKFVGITCTGITASSTCTTSTLAIGASHLMIMSTSAANITLLAPAAPPWTLGGTASSPTLSIVHATSGTFQVNVKDLNGNSLAAGTQVTLTLDNTAIGTFTQTPSIFVVGCAADTGGQDVQASFSATTIGSGIITVKVVAPNGTTTLFTITLNVT